MCEKNLIKIFEFMENKKYKFYNHMHFYDR